MDLPPMVQAKILGEVGHRVRGINETTRLKVQHAIDEGLQDGLGARDLGKLVEASAAFGSYRAEVIARTETNRVLNVSQLSAFQHYGVSLVECIDGDDDDECRARQSRDSGHGPGIYTADEAYSIEDHPNGTLDWAPLTLTEAAEATNVPPAPSLPSAPTMPASLSAPEMESRLRALYPRAQMEGLEKMHASIRAEVTGYLENLAPRYPDVQFDRVMVLPLKHATAKVVGRIPIERGAGGRLVEGKTRLDLQFDSKAFRSPKTLHATEAAYEATANWTVRPPGWTWLRSTVTHEFGHAVDTVRFGLKADVTFAEAPSGYAASTRPGVKHEAEHFAESFVAYEGGMNVPAARAVKDKLG